VLAGVLGTTGVVAPAGADPCVRGDCRVVDVVLLFPLAADAESGEVAVEVPAAAAVPVVADVDGSGTWRVAGARRWLRMVARALWPIFAW
jgi:hypothetical protein